MQEELQQLWVGDFEKLTKPELISECKQLGIEDVDRLNKRPLQLVYLDKMVAGGFLTQAVADAAVAKTEPRAAKRRRTAI